MSEYIKTVFEEYKGNNKGLLTKLRYDQRLRDELISCTSFLPDDTVISERVLYYQNSWTEPQLCPYCQKKKRRFKKLDKGLFPTCGDEECKKAGMIKGAKADRDWKSITAKAKATYKAKTGYDHNMRNPEFIEKYKKEFALTHDGASCGVQTEKARQNRILSYNKRIIEKLNHLNYSLVSFKDDLFEIKCNICGNVISGISRDVLNYHFKYSTPFCEKCNVIDAPKRSKFEQSVANEIKLFYSGRIFTNKKISEHYEADILIPDKKLVIECNGLFYHSEAVRPKNYHWEKKNEIEKLGYILIYIWEDDWMNRARKEIIISRLKSKLNLNERIYARKCEIKEVEGDIARKFLNENHLQGYIQAPYKIGLFYNDELVMITTFGKTRRLIGSKSDIKENVYELYRMCPKKNVNVIGGSSKLISYFCKNYNVKELYTYIDLCWSNINGSGYNKILNFKFEKWTGLDYYWFFNAKKWHRTNFTKQKLVSMGYDKNMSESEIMHKELKAYKIYGPGNLKYKLTMNPI